MDNQGQVKVNQGQVKVNQGQVKVKHIRVAPMPLFKKSGGGG